MYEREKSGMFVSLKEKINRDDVRHKEIRKG
jgi:hypothetical protein